MIFKEGRYFCAAISALVRGHFKGGGRVKIKNGSRKIWSAEEISDFQGGLYSMTLFSKNILTYNTSCFIDDL